MAQDFSRQFYNSPAWKQARNAYANKKHHLCEDCLERGEYRSGDIVHHLIELTPDNIHDLDITLSDKNLRLLCRSCHKRIHGKARRWEVDEFGNTSVR